MMVLFITRRPGGAGAGRCAAPNLIFPIIIPYNRPMDHADNHRRLMANFPHAVRGARMRSASFVKDGDPLDRHEWLEAQCPDGQNWLLKIMRWAPDAGDGAGPVVTMASLDRETPLNFGMAVLELHDYEYAQGLLGFTRDPADKGQIFGAPDFHTLAPSFGIVFYNDGTPVATENGLLLYDGDYRAADILQMTEPPAHEPTPPPIAALHRANGLRVRSATFIALDPNDQPDQRIWLEAICNGNRWVLNDMVWIPPSGDRAPILRRRMHDGTYNFIDTVAALAAFEKSHSESSFIPDPDDSGQVYKAVKFRDLAVQRGIAFLASGDPIPAQDGLLGSDGTYLESTARDILNPDPARPDLITEFTPSHLSADDIYLLRGFDASMLQQFCKDMSCFKQDHFVSAALKAYKNAARLFGYKAQFFRTPDVFDKNFFSYPLSSTDLVFQVIHDQTKSIDFLKEMLFLGALYQYAPTGIAKKTRDQVLNEARRYFRYIASCTGMAHHAALMTTDHYLKNFDMPLAITKIEEIHDFFLDAINKGYINRADQKRYGLTDSWGARLAFDLNAANRYSAPPQMTTVPADDLAGFTLTDDHQHFFKKIINLTVFKSGYFSYSLPGAVEHALVRGSLGRAAYFKKPNFFEDRGLFIKTLSHDQPAIKNLPAPLYQFYVENVNWVNCLVYMRLLQTIHSSVADKSKAVFNHMALKPSPYFADAGLGLYQDLMTSPEYVKGFSQKQALDRVRDIRERFNALANRKTIPNPLPSWTHQDRLAIVYGLSDAYPLPGPA